jgi:L-amino acid N-acyltransferase YncA
VYLDPNFTPERAAGRYVNWMHDELERGGSVHELRVRQVGMGFFVFREDTERTGYSVLSGLYEASTSPGLGSVLLYRILAHARDRGLRRLSSHISTNNPAVVKTHVAQGFTIDDIHYVYVRTTSG